MARERFRRKDLKRPDEFVSRGRDVVDWSRKHGRTVLQIAGGLLVVALVVAGIFHRRGVLSQQANDDLVHGLNDYRANRFAQAATQFNEVTERWGSTGAGGLARLFAAAADLRSDNLGNAVTVLEDARKDAALPSYLQQQAVLNLAYAAERKGDLNAAASGYQAASSIEGPYTATAIYEESRLREQLGDTAAARKLQDRLVNEFSQAPEAELVRAKLGKASA